MGDYTPEEQQEAYKNIAKVRVYTLAQIMKIINTASTRGAFQASEMTLIGSVYDSLSKGVNAAMEAAREDLQERDEQIQVERPKKSKSVSQSSQSSQSRPKQLQQQRNTNSKPIYNPETYQHPELQQQQHMTQHMNQQMNHSSSEQEVPTYNPNNIPIPKPNTTHQMSQGNQSTPIPTYNSDVPTYNPDVPGVKIPKPEPGAGVGIPSASDSGLKISVRPPTQADDPVEGVLESDESDEDEFSD
jgi:hypothetical protein